MEKYFNVYLEFDKNIVDQTIQNAISKDIAGYVCSVESNNLTVANTNPQFLEVVNGALVNICDGSNLAWILNKIHQKDFKSYIGADLFIKYVRMKCYRQYFLGNTDLVLSGLKKNLSQIDSRITEMKFATLPFKDVDDFDYVSIAKDINDDAPDIIWVSLGAPKQEIFMSKLKPLLNRGVMFGFGAIFNFNAGKEASKVQRAPRWMLRYRLEWLYRAFNEPRKNIPRYWSFIKILPRLAIEEKRKIKSDKL